MGQFVAFYHASGRLGASNSSESKTFPTREEAKAWLKGRSARYALSEAFFPTINGEYVSL